MNSLLKLLLTTAILSQLIVNYGCRPAGDQHETGSLHGVVMSNKTPVSGCDINFFDAKTGTGMTATLKEDGAYEIRDQVWTGNYVVYFTPPIPEPAGMDSAAPAKHRPGDFSKLVPKKYQSEATTPLTAKVGPARNTIDFELAP